ncbi:hypothetical protein PQX77_015031 [Marasmius sp. AFHP31]|nr:hypothetical protein PQX77_015031 [Marasmius sp. AFHP31]
METRVILGQVQRVYKNLPPTVRLFFLGASQLHGDKVAVVFERERLTYNELRERAVKAAAVLHDVCGVTKGDRVALCSRNFPDFLVVFWAIHILGAVPVLINAWLPLEPLLHCIKRTDNKVVFVDPERADRLLPAISSLKGKRRTNFIVLQSHEGRGHWTGMETWSAMLKKHRGDPAKVLEKDPQIVPEDNGMIIFTSGSTGLPKGVLLSQRAFLTAIGNAVAGRGRAILRRGEEFPPPPEEGPQPGLLLPTPLFHVTGTTLITLSLAQGLKVVLMRKWDVKEGNQRPLVSSDRILLMRDVF